MLKNKTVIAFFQRTMIIFVCLFIFLLPFPNQILPDTGIYCRPFIEPIIKWIGDVILNIPPPYTHELISDSTGMYILILFCFCLGVLGAFLSTLLSRFSSAKQQFPSWFLLLVNYYLALQLFRYGFNKIFKYQFPLPESNILYTHLGNLSPDLLFWSAVGSSYSYTVFSGIVEIIPATLLLFRRTRLLGALISLGVLAHVLWMNIGFNISVKVLSFFLLMLALILITPHALALYAFFIQKKAVQLSNIPAISAFSKHKWCYYVTKSLLVFIILLETNSIYLESRHFNDDLKPRPFLHGAYQVKHFVINQDTIPPLTSHTNRLKRLFVHRGGYFITQNMVNQMYDYKIIHHIPHHQLQIQSHQQDIFRFNYKYTPADSILVLKGNVYADSLQITAQQLNLQQLPLLQSPFHWTIDYYK